MKCYVQACTTFGLTQKSLKDFFSNAGNLVRLSAINVPVDALEIMLT